MDRLQRRNPGSRSHSSSLKPTRPPRGPAFQPPPASRPFPDPEPSSPDGRPRKKVRFASEAGSHHICVRQDANIGKAEKTKPQGCNAKTTEYKFFKKLWEQSGCTSCSFRQPHQPNISKQKYGMKMELHNVTSHKKVPVQKSTPCSNETPATPSKNEEISGEQVNVQASYSEFDNKDTPQLNPRDSLPTVRVLTPIIQTSFDVIGISRNTDIEPGSEQIFSEKRRKLLKLAAKTVSMESSELLQRRSEFFADILQRLGANDIINKHHKESMRQRKMVCRHTPADPREHFERLLDFYRLSDFDPLTKLRTGKESSSYATDEVRQCTALPLGYNWGHPSFLDWKNNLPYASNEAFERMPLPSVYTTDLSSSDWKRDTVHNQVSNLLLEDVQPHTKGKPVSANELSCNIQTGKYDHHGREPTFSVTLPGSIPNRLSFPCQIEDQDAVPYAISNTFWQPDLLNSLEQCLSSSVGLEAEDPKEAGLFDNSDAGLLSRFDQFRAKCSASSFLDIRNGILDHSGFRYVSNFQVSEGNNIVANANRSCLNSICLTSTLEHPFELGSKSLCDSALHVSCLDGPEENYLTETELFDKSDNGLLQGLDQLPVKFTASTFSKYTSGVLDHHLRYMSNPKDSISIFSLDANDTCLNSLSSYSEHPCKQDWKNSCDSSTELWSSVHHLQSHGGNLGSVLGFMSNGSICVDLEDHHNAILVEGNPNNDMFGASNLSLFGSCSTTDSIRETPLSSPDGIRW